jgi:hypothetical protein
MNIDGSAIHEVPPPPSSAVVRLGLEMDMTMKSVSDFSHTFPTPAEYQSRIDLTREHEASGDIEQKPEGDWDLDTRNPRNWPLSKKWVAVSVVSSPCRYYSWTFNMNMSLRYDRFQHIPSSPLLLAL